MTDNSRHGLDSAWTGRSIIFDALGSNSFIFGRRCLCRATAGFAFYRHRRDCGGRIRELHNGKLDP